MKKMFSFLFIGFLFVLCFGCQESEVLSPRNYPVIQTLELSTVDENGITIEAQLIKNGPAPIESYGVEYLESKFVENENFGESYLTKEIIGLPEGNQFSVRVEHDLIEGEEYYARPFVKSKGYKVYGQTLIFEAEGSRAPQIDEVNSTVLGMRLEFVIKGDFFSTRVENNMVEVPGTEGRFQLNILEAKSNMLRVQVLGRGTNEDVDQNLKFDLVVTTLGKKTVLPDYFSIGYPRITSINTLKAKPGDELLVNLNLEEEKEFMYLSINYDQNSYLLLPLTKVSGDLYHTVLREFPPGKYQLGFLVEGSFKVYSEKFEVLPE